MPAVAVNRLNDVVISFLRYPAAINTTKRSQIRYKVLFHDETEFRSSGLAKESEVPGNETLDIDYSWVTQDPFHLNDYWIANSFRNKDGGRSTHVAKVSLSKN